MRYIKNIITSLIIFMLYLQSVLISSPSLERNLKISNLCQDILSIHPKTRCSSFINRNGRVVESKFRDDGNNTGLTCQELEMLYMQCKLQSSMNTEFNRKLGHLRYTLICRESALEFIFPFCDGVIFVSLDKDIPIQSVSKNISELMAKFESGSEVGIFDENA